MPCETSGDIEINAGASLIEIEVANTGDRPIQVGSHYPFLETNKALVYLTGAQLSAGASMCLVVPACA